MTHEGRLPWAEARARASSAPRLLGTEHVALEQGLGRVLRAPVAAAIDIPHYASAAMDGWAVAGSGPWMLRAPGSLSPGDALPIVTGGLLPEGADAVVRQEDTEPAADGAITIAVTVPSGVAIMIVPSGPMATPSLPSAGARYSTNRNAPTPTCPVASMAPTDPVSSSIRKSPGRSDSTTKRQV